MLFFEASVLRDPSLALYELIEIDYFSKNLFCSTKEEVICLWDSIRVSKLLGWAMEVKETTGWKNSTLRFYVRLDYVMYQRMLSNYTNPGSKTIVYPLTNVRLTASLKKKKKGCYFLIEHDLILNFIIIYLLVVIYYILVPSYLTYLII